MKTHLCLTVVGLACCVAVSVAFAAEPGAPRGSLYRAEDLGLISISGNYAYQDRDVGTSWMLESQSAYAVLSVDAYYDWITLSIGGGSTHVKPGPREHYDDWGSLWMTGLKLGLWEYDVKDPTYLLSRTRIQGSASYWNHNAQILDKDVKWDEWRAAMLFSAEFFSANLGADKTLYPFATVLTIGPLYSMLDGDSRGSLPGSPMAAYDFDKQTDWGLQIGIDVYLSHNFSFGWEARTFDGFHGKAHDLYLALHF